MEPLIVKMEVVSVPERKLSGTWRVKKVETLRTEYGVGLIEELLSDPATRLYFEKLARKRNAMRPLIKRFKRRKLRKG